MNNPLEQKFVVNKDILVTLVADAYGHGLVAGQKTPEVKDDADFRMAAVGLFSSGFSAMLDEPANKLEI